MNHRRLPILIPCAALILVCMNLSGCGQKSKDNPATLMQAELASRLANPDVCPSGDSLDIQKAIDASGDHGIVHIPEGCFQIKSTLTLPPCMQLEGAGADKTILYRQAEKTYSSPILQVRGKQAEGCVAQISGMALIGVRNTDDSGQDYGIVLTNVKDFRIDHSYFEGFGFAGVKVEGEGSGVVDHCFFVDNFKRGIDNLGYGVVVYGKGSWDANLQPGGPLATFVEDSLFYGNRHAIAANAGAHYVFRYNQVLRNVEACSVDAHGMGYGSAHGTQYVEIYRNVIQDPVYGECGIGIRGGAGVIFENIIQGYKNPLLLILEWGTPDAYKAKYPALDQIQDLYIWDNQITGGHAQPQVDETGKDFIELGRDYFTEALTGYAAYPYPHPLANGGPFDDEPWPTIVSP